MSDEAVPAAVADPPARALKVVPMPVRSSTCWSPEQLLEELLADIRSGKVIPTNLMVFWMNEEPGGHLRPCRWIANVSRSDEIAYYTLGIHKAVDDWRGGD